MARNIVFARVLKLALNGSTRYTEYAGKSLVKTSSAAIPSDQQTVHTVVY